MWFGGVDVGSISTEAVLISEDGRVAAASIGATGADSVAASERALNEALTTEIAAGLNFGLALTPAGRSTSSPEPAP